MKEIPMKIPETTFTMMPVAMSGKTMQLPKEEAKESNHMKKISELNEMNSMLQAQMEEMNDKLQAQTEFLKGKLEMASTNELQSSDLGETNTVGSLKMENKLLGLNQGQDNEDSGEILDIYGRSPREYKHN
eukprot:13193032-Ditylum_brightwellii.AAC.1